MRIQHTMHLSLQVLVWPYTKRATCKNSRIWYILQCLILMLPATMVVRDNRKRCCIHAPSPLQGVVRVWRRWKYSASNSPTDSVTAHVDDVVGMCVRSMYSISVLRSLTASRRQVFRAVVVSKLIHATPAWWGFTTSVDGQSDTAAYQCCSASSCSVWPVVIDWEACRRAYVRGPLQLSWWRIVHQN